MPPKKTATKTTATKPRVTSRKKKPTNVVDSVADLKPEEVMNEVGALTVSMQSTLAGIGAAISQKLEAMQNLDKALAAKGEELAELYEIEKDAQDLESVRSMRQQEDEDWEKKKENRLAEWADDESERAKKWQREDETHAYDHSQKVARDKEQFNAEKSERERLESIRLEDLQRDWTAREEGLKGQEEELDSFKERVEQFEEEMKREVAKAEAQASQRVKRDFEHQIALLNKDAEAAAQLASTEKQAQQDTISNLSEQLEDTQKQLESARADAKDVTSAALQSASGRDSLAAVQTSLSNTNTKK
jgi:hypothetical protein